MSLTFFWLCAGPACMNTDDSPEPSKNFEEGGSDDLPQDRGMVETQIVRLVVRIFPVVHENYKGMARVISLVALPGVNLAKCIQRVCDPRFYDNRHGDVARGREALWREILHAEFGVMEDTMRHDDMEGFLGDFENYQDLDHHMFHFLSECMVVWRLLAILERRFSSMGFDGTHELSRVHIPGMANPYDRRCGTEAMVINLNAYQRALALESGSILAWVEAFNLCRIHHSMMLASSGSGSGKGKNAAAALAAASAMVDDEETLDDVRNTNRAQQTANDDKYTRLQYFLPSIFRPAVNAEHMDDYDEASVANGTAPGRLEDLVQTDMTWGFHEASVTMVARPMVSQDFLFDFSRGYDMGGFPPLVRIVLLDFVIGCSDPDVAECVLSDADLVPLTTFGRQQRFHSTLSNCMDTYVRQDVFGAWKGGFEKHQKIMSDKYSQGPDALDSWRVVRMLMEKADFYGQQALQFHCSNITDGVYRSEILTHIYEVYSQLKSVFHARVKENIESWGVKSRPVEWNSVDTVSQMRLLFYRGLREFNQAAHMSYTNIAIVTELFTTMIQWFIHPGNVTWSNWLIPIQVVPQKAQLYRMYHRDGSKAISVDKPNSTGLDEVTCRGFEGMMHLCNGEVTRSDGRALDLAMCKAGRETPCARERRNKVMICKNCVVAEPDPSLVNRMQSSTEERNLGDADLDAKIRVTPRNRTTIRDGTVFTTDTTEKGSRESQRWEPVGGYHIGVQATNCRINSMRNQEQWETQLVATKCMSTGRDTERKRPREHRGDFTVNHASGSSQTVRDPKKCKELSTLLCAIPHLTGAFIGMMNKLGFMGMELAPISSMYMDWMYWRFDSLFSRFVGVRLGKSFQRTTQGHYGRHISDYAMARLTLEVSKFADFDTALVRSMNVLSYNCLPLGAVAVWMDDSMREGVDGQLLVLHNVLSSMMQVPNVHLPWLMKALKPYESLSPSDRVYVDSHPDAHVLALWVKSLVDNDQFMFEQEITVHGGGGNGEGGGNDSAVGGAGVRIERGAKRVYPYITTPASASEEMSFLRTRTKNKGYASEEIAKKLVKHPDMVMYSKHTGFTVDEQVAKCMIDRCSHLTLGLADAFGTQELCNPETLFALTRRKLGVHSVVSPISDVVQRNMNAMIDPSYAMMQSVTVFDTQELMFGVNMNLIILLTSMCEGNSGASSQVDERLTRSLMWLMMRDVPLQFVGQTGQSYLRKNFRGMCPACDFNSLDGYTEPRPAYVVRPVHDHEKEFNRMTHFSCSVYKTYAPEDCAHMGELASLSHTYNASSVLDISLTFATPRYMFMYDRIYPIAFTQEGVEYERVRVGESMDTRVRGYLVVKRPQSIAVGNIPANTIYWKLRYQALSGTHFHDASGFDLAALDDALATRYTVVLPLIARHNAVIYCGITQSYGVILPEQTELRETFHGDTYFNSQPCVWGYRVLMEGHNLSTYVHLDALNLESKIVALASNIWIRADIYFMCRGGNFGHADAPRILSNPQQTAQDMMYIPAVISYPNSYPTTMMQVSSMFVEIAYAGRGNGEQDKYVQMEINLERLYQSGVYTQAYTTPPLCHQDPRYSLGVDGISIVSFTSSGFV